MDLFGKYKGLRPFELGFTKSMVEKKANRIYLSSKAISSSGKHNKKK